MRLIWLLTRRLFALPREYKEKLATDRANKSYTLGYSTERMKGNLGSLSQTINVSGCSCSWSAWGASPAELEWAVQTRATGLMSEGKLDMNLSLVIFPIRQTLGCRALLASAFSCSIQKQSQVAK